MDSRPAIARGLFAPIAADYERWARVLSLGQDGRWRRRMIAGLGAPASSLVLDLAAGTGSISRALAARGHAVVACDQSAEMLTAGDLPGSAVQATAERLPFADEAFDAVTLGYLIRYVDDVPALMHEISRVVRPGGVVGMVEFGRPSGVAGPVWRLYTRRLLPAFGRVIGHGWDHVGRFLADSIEDLAQRYPPPRLTEVWHDAGIGDVAHLSMSFGGGWLAWGRKR